MTDTIQLSICHGRSTAEVHRSGCLDIPRKGLEVMLELAASPATAVTRIEAELNYDLQEDGYVCGENVRVMPCCGLGRKLSRPV